MTIRPAIKQAGLPEKWNTSEAMNQFLYWKFFKGEK